MIKRFTFELTVGIIMLIAVFLFGTKGLSVLALLAVHPFIGRKKADERESQLFNKVGNYTAGATVLACVIIYYFSGVVVNGQALEKLWFCLAVSAFIIAHGAAGLIVFKKSE